MKRRRKRIITGQFPKLQIDAEEVEKDASTRAFLSKFREQHVRTVFYLALLGLTEEQMAVVFDVQLATFIAWKDKHPTFKEAMLKGKEQADARVVYSYYQAAIGYEHPDEQIFCSKEKIYGQDANGKTILLKEVPKIIRVPTIKRYPPNVRAASNWLEVRQPAQWTKRKDAKAVLAITNNNYDLRGLSMDELKVLQKIGLNMTPDADGVFHTTAQKELKNLEP